MATPSTIVTPAELDRIERKALALGMSLGQLSARISIHPTSWSRWRRRGRVRYDNWAAVLRLEKDLDERIRATLGPEKLAQLSNGGESR